MTTPVKKSKTNIKKLTEGFWALSRIRQEAFLKNLYELSPQNKDLFRLRLGKDTKSVVESLKKEIHKETLNRVGKFRKLRLSKINTILRNANKYALPVLEQIEIKRAVCFGMLEFIVSKTYLPERYEVACARHFDQYFKMVKGDILEASEREEVLNKDRDHLMNIIKGYYVPYVEDMHREHFR